MRGLLTRTGDARSDPAAPLPAHHTQNRLHHPYATPTLSTLSCCRFLSLLLLPAGYHVGVLNTALPYIAKDLHYHRDGMLSSAVVVGAAAGALTAGKLADTLGPRHAQV